MKKTLLALLTLLMVLTACSSSKPEAKMQEEMKSVQDEMKADDQAMMVASYKIGSYALTDAFTPKDNGELTVNTTIVTVLLDAEGKVVNANIDVAQNKVSVVDGVATLPTDTPSKAEKGDAYGMKKQSAIGKEWYEQAEALAKIFVGKTAAEIAALEVNDKRTFADEDLASVVSIKVPVYIEATLKAIENAREVAGEIAKIGAANTTAITDKAPADDKNGTITINTYIGWVALDKDNKVLGAFIDTAQNQLNYTSAGYDAANAPVESKQVLAGAYGMKEVSSIKKEWNEQADGLTAYLVGKSASDIATVAVDEKGKATDEQLLSTTTISITKYLELLTKAANQAIEAK